MSLNIGEKFADYEILETIGSGATAVVYKAIDGQGRIVALKLLADNLVTNENVVKRFRKEGATMLKLNHVGIVRVFEEGVYEGRPYIATEYMPKGSLASLYKGNSLKIKLRNTVFIIRQIAVALDYAHSQDVIHRDLKPENILMNANRRLAIADFGLAQSTADTRMTVSGMLGSIYTCSPEQITNAHDVQTTTDLYSLAVIGYLFATGHYPFTGTAHDILQMHLNYPPPRPSLVNPDLPEELDDVLLKGLSKNPQERYQSARAFAKDYGKAIEGVDDITVIIQPDIANPRGRRLQDYSQIMNSSEPKRGIRPALTMGVVGVIIVILLALIGFQFVAGNNANSASAIETHIAETASAWTDTPTLTATNTPTATLTLTSTATETATDTPTTETSTPTITTSPTVTSSPTITPTSSQTPVPVIEGSIDVGGVNLRSAPSLNSSVRDVLLEGETVIVIGRTANNTWYEVETDANSGWIAAAFLIKDPSAIPDVTWEAVASASESNNQTAVAAPPTATLRPQIRDGSDNTDSDGDGYSDAVDACPYDGNNGNGLSSNGCPIPWGDRDGDGYTDNLDSCPTEGNQGYGVDSRGCPIVPPDSDGDGYIDSQDSCPTEGNQGYGVDSRGCSIVPPDSDGDGYIDSQDSCPTQGNQGYGVDSRGCPIATPVTVESQNMLVSSRSLWQRTGINVSAGNQIVIDGVTGVWAWTSGGDYFGIEGDTIGQQTCRSICDKVAPNDTPIGYQCPLPDQTIGRLVVRVGEQGSVFSVNSNNTYNISSSGALYFRMNDCDGGIHDNAGSIDFRVNVHK